MLGKSREINSSLHEPFMSEAKQPMSKPLHVWVGLLGGLIAGAAFAVPVTRLADRSFTAWDLITNTKQISERMAIQRDKMNEIKEKLPPSPFPKKGPNPLRKKLEGKVREAKGTFDLTDSILIYTRWGLIALLATAAAQLVPVVVRSGPGFHTLFGLFTGILGSVFTGTLVILIFYLDQVELLGEKLPLLSGYWSATAGVAVLALSGLLSVGKRSWFYPSSI